MNHRAPTSEDVIVDRTTAGKGRRLAARLAAAPAATLVALLASAAPAAAHVTLTPSTTAAGAYAVLEISIPHGCQGSPTTAVTIQVPEGIHSVTPTRNALWDVTKETVVLDPPVTDSHGAQVTERVASVTYSAKEPLPEGYRDTFELSVQLPDDEGATLAFPTVQRCQGAESAWIEVPGPGVSADDLELPAPALTITAAAGDGHGHDAAATDAAHSATDDAAATVEAEDGPAAAEAPTGSRALVLTALVAGLLGALLGAAALLLQRRRR